jgi:DNA-binding Lrp family transcriptional regulator
MINANHKLQIDQIDQRLIELLLEGYTDKKIASHRKSPVSTILRRIRRIFENEYFIRKNELNHKKLGLRKVYLFISLKGDSSSIAKRISNIRGITFISLLTGGERDILCICTFKSANDLFKIVENIRSFERVDKVTCSEEVSIITTKDATITRVEDKMVEGLQDRNIE